jgi:hypothetical protein
VMQTILAQPFGRLLLTTVGLGFVAFGPFATVQSRSAGGARVRGLRPVRDCPIAIRRMYPNGVPQRLMEPNAAP